MLYGTFWEKLYAINLWENYFWYYRMLLIAGIYYVELISKEWHSSKKVVRKPSYSQNWYDIPYLTHSILVQKIYYTWMISKRRKIVQKCLSIDTTHYARSWKFSKISTIKIRKLGFLLRSSLQVATLKMCCSNFEKHGAK